MTTPSIWQSYKDINPLAPQPVLQSIINAFLISVEDRQALVQALLKDVKDGRFPPQDAATALLAVKTLARIPAASQILIEPANLRILFQLATDSRPGVSAEALKCVANAMLLLEPARDAWLELGGGQLALDLLMDPKSTPEFCFLAARTLFLTTMKQNSFLKRVAEDAKVIDAVAARLDTLLSAHLASQTLAKEALIDVLKFVFNLLLQYPRMVDADAKEKGKAKEDEKPKVMGEQWDERFERLIIPLVRVFNTLPETKPPLAPPLTHVIHALINVPVPPYTSKWFSAPGTPITTGSSSPSSSAPSSNSNKAAEVFQRALARLAKPRRSSSSSRRRSNSPTSPTTSTQQQTSSPSDTSYEIVRRTTDLIDATLAHYFPGAIDVDDASVREKATKEGINIDELATPLLALAVRMAEDTGARKLFKDWILPADLNRDSPLEAREDSLGRFIRLMSCVYFPRLKDTIGEMLYTICNSDGSLLSAQIGYGNAAGYLFNKGILSAPPPSTGDGGSGEDSAYADGINPITGAKQREVNTGPEMTEEEKEREAEKLFVLFDRLEKTGIGIQNPIRKAIQEGKLSMGPFGP